jgi:ABC-2 type transport system permease protein
VGGVPGTSESRRSGGNPMMMRQQPQKGSLNPLWELLGKKIDGDQTVCQDYLPIRQQTHLKRRIVFLDRSLEKDSGVSPFCKEEAITSGLQYMSLPFPGRITEYDPMFREKRMQTLTETPLLRTFHQPAGIIHTSLLSQLGRLGSVYNRSWEDRISREKEPMNLAVRIQGELPPPPAPELKEGERPERPKTVQIDVILVADIDLLSDAMLNLRREFNESDFDFDNVTFVLNAIDSVAKDDRFIEIRSRRSRHRTLSRFDEHTVSFREMTAKEKENSEKEFAEKEKMVKDEVDEKVESVRKGLMTGTMNEGEAMRRLAMAEMTAYKRLKMEIERLEWDLSIKKEKADVALNENISRVQGQYKLWSVVLPPIRITRVKSLL